MKKAQGSRFTVHGKSRIEEVARDTGRTVKKEKEFTVDRSRLTVKAKKNGSRCAARGWHGQTSLVAYGEFVRGKGSHGQRRTDNGEQ